MQSLKNAFLMIGLLAASTSCILGITNITSDAAFNTAIQQNDYVVVDFFMPSCGPCKQLAPKLEAIERDLTNVKFIKVDVTKVDSLAKRFSIRAVPKLIFFKNGVEVGSQVGNGLSAVELQQKIQNLFGI